MKQISIILIVLTVLSSCGKNRNLSPQDSATVKRDVEQMLSAVADSLHARGLAGWLTFMHQSPDFYWEFHGTRSSYDSLAAGERRESSRYQAIALAWDSIQVKPITLDKATFSAHYVEVVVDRAGKHTTFSGSVEANAVKVSGSWKLQNGRTIDD